MRSGCATEPVASSNFIAPNSNMNVAGAMSKYHALNSPPRHLSSASYATLKGTCIRPGDRHEG
jgi:hypothetical protein